MATILPKNPQDRITFCEVHNAPWSSAAVAIGTTAAKVTNLATLTASARAAFLAQREAQAVARSATNTYKNAVRAMSTACTEILLEVKAKAASAGGGADAIYDLAQVPPPATPSPVPPPGMPEAFKVTLTPDGWLELAWKCQNPAGAAGTVYQVARKIGAAAAAEFAILGSSGIKKFIDNTVPAGAAQVTYRVQAIRSTQVGVANNVTVNFGVGGGGEMIASVGATGAPKLAA